MAEIFHPTFSPMNEFKFTWLNVHSFWTERYKDFGRHCQNINQDVSAVNEAV